MNQHPCIQNASSLLAQLEKARLTFEYNYPAWLTFPRDNLTSILNSYFPQHPILLFGGFDHRVVAIDVDGVSVYLFSACEGDVQGFLSANKIVDFHLYSNKSAIASFSLGDFVRPNIALISLAIPEIQQYPRFPLAISVIANAIRNGFLADVDLFDLQIPDHRNNLFELLTQAHYDVIGLSTTFGQYDLCCDIANNLTRLFPHSKIVIGGNLPAISPKPFLDRCPTALISLGEGELFFSQLLKYLSAEVELREIESTAFFDSLGNLQITPRKHHHESATLPELDLLIPTFQNLGVFQLETSRGCYNQCSFCPRHLKGEWRSTDYLTDQLPNFLKLYKNTSRPYMNEHRANVVYLVDEEFIGGLSPRDRSRAVAITEHFHDFNLSYEMSFRMDNVFLSTDTHEMSIDKIKTLKKIRDNGLKRLLIGVESGVDPILIRFNKNVTSKENATGIRIISALDLPTRFTYITFDPLMSFDELIETYQFLGRTDLLLNKWHGEDSALLSLVTKEALPSTYLKNEPFYLEVSYMLVSLECLERSPYLKHAIRNKLHVRGRNFTLGKRDVDYLDKRIESMSHYSQLWIDRNYSLDYTLKSLAKLYPNGVSDTIRDVRKIYKRSSYTLLGEMISFAKDKDTGTQIDYSELLNQNFAELAASLGKSFSFLYPVLSPMEAKALKRQYTTWKATNRWTLINQ